MQEKNQYAATRIVSISFLGNSLGRQSRKDIEKASEAILGSSFFLTSYSDSL